METLSYAVIHTLSREGKMLRIVNVYNGLVKMAERVGFEPTVPCGTQHFQCCALDHSATSPWKNAKCRPEPYEMAWPNGKVILRDPVATVASLFADVTWPIPD